MDLPERRKRYTSSREQEEVGTLICPCGKAVGNRTHIVGECETYKEEWDVSEEMTKIDECDMDYMGALHSSERTIAILGDRYWPQAAKQEAHHKISKKLSMWCMETTE